jgi:hypothetical protein
MENWQLKIENNMNTPYQIEQRLLDLALRLGRAQPQDMVHPRQNEIPEWRGADVRLTSDFTWEPGDFIEQHDLLVRTRHAQALTWLFFELRDTFSDWLDAGNKYGFFGSLALVAQKHLARHQPESADPRPLLKVVLAEGFHWHQILRQTGELPDQPEIILHSHDTEGRQYRANFDTGAPCA